MSFDDRILSLQRAIDRLVRRFRGGGVSAPTQRRFLIVQIDGLSRAVLERGLAAGHMPFLQRLLQRHHYRLEPMSVGLPTSTPAFQMAMMYGVRPDIPGFHYYSRVHQHDIHFPRAGHAALVEAQHATNRRGILHGGSVYGCIFTGGADNNFFSFTRLTRPTTRGLLAALSPFAVLAWVCLKSLLQTVLELIQAVARLIRHPVSARRRWRWLTMKIGLSVWVRGFFTLAASRDLYAGAPAVYVNYLDYDVAAHAFGPRSRRALGALRRVDRAIHQLWRVVRRVPEYQYDLYILSDHGQAACTPYPDLTGGQRFERWIFDRLLDPPQAQPTEDRLGLMHGIRLHRREATPFLQSFLNYVDEDFLQQSDPEAHERNGIRVIAAGPNAFLYVLDVSAPLDADAVEHRFPGLIEQLSVSPGVGFVLARSSNGPLCCQQGKRYQLGECDAGPFSDRADASLVVQGIIDLMRMPSVGDLVIYGIGAPGQHVSFIPEVGAHAGPSPEELHTFIICAEKVTLPNSINHPVQLYDHFIRYRRQS